MTTVNVRALLAGIDAYVAATVTPSHRRSFLGDWKSLVLLDSSDSAICMRDWAQRRSRAMYSTLVERNKSEEGMRANSGSNSGACSDVSESRPYILRFRLAW